MKFNETDTIYLHWYQFLVNLIKSFSFLAMKDNFDHPSLRVERMKDSLIKLTRNQSFYCYFNLTEEESTVPNHLANAMKIEQGAIKIISTPFCEKLIQIEPHGFIMLYTKEK